MAVSVNSPPSTLEQEAREPHPTVRPVVASWMPCCRIRALPAVIGTFEHGPPGLLGGLLEPFFREMRSFFFQGAVRGKLRGIGGVTMACGVGSLALLPEKT